MRTPLLLTAISCLPLIGCATRPDTLVIAHRGASGYLPEHTLEAYSLAYGMNADVIEPDVVLTRDGVLVCSHDLTIHNPGVMAAAFPDRRRPDGNWYFIDFDLAELKALNAPLGRNAETAQGMQIATLDEMILLVQRLNKATGRSVEIIPEPKSPKFHRDAGNPLEPVVVETLARHGYTSRTDGAIIQCFDLDALKRIRHQLHCDLRLVYLVSKPVEDVVLEGVAAFADGFGPSRRMIEGDNGEAGTQPDIIRKSHARGLPVYMYTFGNDEATVRRFMQTHAVDALFTDFPDIAVRVRDGE